MLGPCVEEVSCVSGFGAQPFSAKPLLRRSVVINMAVVVATEPTTFRRLRTAFDESS